MGLFILIFMLTFWNNSSVIAKGHTIHFVSLVVSILKTPNKCLYHSNTIQNGLLNKFCEIPYEILYILTTITLKKLITQHTFKLGAILINDCSVYIKMLIKEKKLVKQTWLASEIFLKIKRTICAFQNFCIQSNRSVI